MMQRFLILATALTNTIMSGPPAFADDTTGYLASIRHQHLMTSTVPDNGDQNPYALVIAPVSAGTVEQGDVLVDNFNNSGNLQGTGSTVIDYNPLTKQATTFATIPHDIAGCPGGVGLSTAMIMLKSGWVIVGSAPSTDGTTKTLGPGCLIVLSSSGKVAGTITGPEINDPWGNMAVIDKGDSATLFVSNAGFGIGAPGQPIQNKATVLRISLAISDGKPPQVTNKTVIAAGLPSQADASVFLIGPTGLVLGKSDDLYVSDAIGNRILSIPDAVTRNDAGTAKEITRDGFLHRPLAMTLAPNGNLLVINGLDGNVVEIDPESGKQLGVRMIDGDEAQTPPGSGDLFGIAISQDGKGFYFVEDDVNTLEKAE